MIIRKIIVIILIFFLTSCLSRVENKGYSFYLTDYKIKRGLSGKDEIIKNMGSPTLISYIDNEAFWIYFEEEVRKLLFFKPKILSRKILLVTFDENNIVKTLDHYELDDENNIKFNEKHTKVRKIKRGFFADLFGNIGQVSAQ